MAEIGGYFASTSRPRAPGVYIEDGVPSPAAGLRTGVPVFIGFTQNSGRAHEEYRVEDARLFRLTSWEEFEQRVGRAIPGGFLEYAVHGFFENGGERCVVVPLKLREDQRGSATLKEALRSLFKKGEMGLRGVLEDLEDTDLVCVPDIMIEDIRGSQETVFELQQLVLEYCKDMGDRFAILDTLPIGDDDERALLTLIILKLWFLRPSPAPFGDVEEALLTPVDRDDRERVIQRVIQHWQELLPTEGALYFPWIKDRTGVWGPPCGHIAGIYARTDAQIGVHKAPANEIVEGAMDLEAQLSDEDQSRLNEVGVNCLRSFRGRGIRVWGARTLSGLPNWRYVNVRRLFLTVIRWIEHNTHDLVFEPNGPPLWDRVRDRLGSYCYGLFQRGALQGSTPAEAFFVKCDAETNPLTVRDAGQLVCEIGLAVMIPAEFVVVRITQSAAGTRATILTGT
jgi:uncharacterized protein